MVEESAKSKRHYIKSSSFIMAAFFTILCGMAALSLGYFINYFTTGHFVHSTHAALDSRFALIDAIGLEKKGVQGDYYLQILSGDGEVLEDIDIKETFAEGMIVFDFPDNQQRYAAKRYDLSNGDKILIGLNITQIAEDFKFMQIMGICSIIFVMIVVFVSYLISVFVVSGTNKIAGTAEDIIQTGDLSRRITVTSRWDDLSNMSAVLNILLERIEDLMTGVRRVSDNIAHDLRTPLTRMRNHIEELQKKYGHDDYSKLLDEADYLLSTFTALLRISRIETEKQRSHFAPVDLQQIIADVAAFYDPLAEEKNISLHVETVPAGITGDKDLLFQAFANILDNAIKFAPEGGAVKISLIHDDELRVIIEDNGPGVSTKEQEKIFDRFYRSDSSRSTVGTGLGLSLVKVVITLHGGSVKAENAEPGLRIITIL